MIDHITHCTLRIECQLDGGGSSCGTGFIYSQKRNENEFYLYLVTNRHVVEGAASASFFLSTSDASGNKNWGSNHKVEIGGIQKAIEYHPDPTIDLAAMPLPEVLHHVQANGVTPYFRTIDSSITYQPSEHKFVGSFEEVVMVGYPNGLWDEENNLPIVRSGVTATPISRKWNGRPYFVIDCACFPGSSGSPILLHQKGMIPTSDGKGVTPVERLLFVGVLFAGPQFKQDGTIEIKEVPTAAVPFVSVNGMMNLGYCISAEAVADFLGQLIKEQ